MTNRRQPTITSRSGLQKNFHDKQDYRTISMTGTGGLVEGGHTTLSGTVCIWCVGNYYRVAPSGVLNTSKATN